MPPLVEVEDLVKVYGGGVRAVDGVTFYVDQGEVFGFLGPNGAGKTTTIRVLVTRLEPTSGSAMVDGIDVVARPDEVRRRIGYAAQFIGIDDDLTARENLVMQGRLHGMSSSRAAAEADHLLEVIDLTDAAGRRAGTFSGGMRRRLDLAQALVHRPGLLFLDEPTTGLDPQNRRALWNYLRSLNEQGVTIFLTTQYLEEADELASRLAIIDHGKIVVEGTPQELKSGVGGDTITVTLHSDSSPEEMAAAESLLGAIPGAGDLQRFDHSVAVYVADGGARLVEVVRALDAGDVTVAKLQLAEPSLDEVFLRHTGERLRVEEVKQQRRINMTRRRRSS
jgi:daunorubicin resistance ABC transporter ATP-binding subunit